MLNKGTHPNVILQRSWSKRGEASFAFKILREVPESCMFMEEGCEIDRLNTLSPGGYNIDMPAADCPRAVAIRQLKQKRLVEFKKVRACKSEKRKRIIKKRTAMDEAALTKRVLALREERERIYATWPPVDVADDLRKRASLMEDALNKNGTSPLTITEILYAPITPN